MRFIYLVTAALLTSQCYGHENFNPKLHVWSPPTYDAILKFTKKDIAFYCDLVDEHYHKGKECQERAEKMSYLLPEGTDKDMAIYCFTTFMSSFSSNTSKAKIASMAITLLTNYGIQIISQWHAIIRNMHEAQYHYEMSDFYYDVLYYHNCEDYYNRGDW